MKPTKKWYSPGGYWYLTVWHKVEMLLSCSCKLSRLHFTDCFTDIYEMSSMHSHSGMWRGISGINWSRYNCQLYPLHASRLILSIELPALPDFYVFHSKMRKCLPFYFSKQYLTQAQCSISLIFPCSSFLLQFPSLWVWTLLSFRRKMPINHLENFCEV